MPHKQMAIQRAWRDVSDGAQRPAMVAIAGDSAAGKTTLTRGLVAALGTQRCNSFCVDDYHRYDRQERKQITFTPLHPSCNYVDIMEQHLQLVALGQPVLKPVYNHHNGTLDRPVLFAPTEHVIVEGLLPLHTRLARACFDLTVYLDPPEPIRRGWKLKRDTRDRGYGEAEVLAELDRREPESAAWIRPQRAWADIVIRFAHIAERGEGGNDPLSVTILLRPTVRHPDLTHVLSEDSRSAIHLKLVRDDDGKPVDALHIHAYASRDATREVEAAIWGRLGASDDLPDTLGRISDGARSEPLALTQLILLYHLIQARQAGAPVTNGSR
jgi:phosphoribulokinase